MSLETTGIISIIVFTFPASWNCINQSQLYTKWASFCSHKLRPLVDHVRSLGRTLEKKYASGVTEIETNGLARRLKKMLVELNDYDNARDIARTFSLREAL